MLLVRDTDTLDCIFLSTSTVSNTCKRLHRAHSSVDIMQDLIQARVARYTHKYQSLGLTLPKTFVSSTIVKLFQPPC